VADKRASMTTCAQWQEMTNNVSMQQKFRAATKRARVARAMVNEGGG
jgi:hypothetical protein